MAFWSWSKTAATNSSADVTINWAEGQAPSSVNDSARAMMARTAEYRDDIAGAIVTGGTSTAYTVTSYQVFDTLAHMNGALIAFTPHTANGATVTLNVDGLGAKPLRLSTSVELQSNVLIAGTPYMATYNNSDAVWYLHSIGGNTYGVPLLAGMDFWGTTAPSSAFVFPTGQAVSRTTYATAFALMGTTFGAGDGSTTFNLPDKTGRVSAMKEASASRLTSTYFGASGATLGAVGGAESHNLVTAQTPSHTHTFTTGTESVLHTHGGVITSGNTILVASGGGTGVITSLNTGSSGSETPFHSHTGTTDATGTSASHNNVQPTIVCNYILRIV